MTRRIGEVSAEAERTGQQSAKVRDDTVGLNTLVGELKRSVTRVVRNSTTEVDRRHSAQHPLMLPCRLTVAGQATQAATVADLSQGGAMIMGGPTLSAGGRGTLELDQVGMPLPFVVRTGDDGVCRLAFELDAATAGRFAQVLERLAAPRAA